MMQKTAKTVGSSNAARLIDREFGGGEHGELTLLVLRAASRDSIRKLIERHMLEPHCGGPGQFYADRVFVCRRGGVVIVRQHYGFDI